VTLPALHVQPKAGRDPAATRQYGVEHIRQTVNPGLVGHGQADPAVQTERPASPTTRTGVTGGEWRGWRGWRSSHGSMPSRRHPAGEPATRHGTAGRSGKDHDTTEPRAGSPVGEGGGHVPGVSEGRCLEPASHR
jgi:hypothetical protein